MHKDAEWNQCLIKWMSYRSGRSPDRHGINREICKMLSYSAKGHISMGFHYLSMRIRELRYSNSLAALIHSLPNFQSFTCNFIVTPCYTFTGSKLLANINRYLDHQTQEDDFSGTSRPVWKGEEAVNQPFTLSLLKIEQVDRSCCLLRKGAGSEDPEVCWVIWVPSNYRLSQEDYSSLTHDSMQPYLFPALGDDNEFGTAGPDPLALRDIGLTLPTHLCEGIHCGSACHLTVIKVNERENRDFASWF